MRKFVTSLFAGLATTIVFATTPAAAFDRSCGGSRYEGCNPARAEHIANCVNKLPRWGHRNPCTTSVHGQRGGQQTRGVRTTTTVRTGSHQVYRGRVAVRTGTMLANRRTGEQIFIPAR